MATPRDEWRARVGRVFNTRPRIGVGKRTIWLSRSKAMETFRDTFYNPGTHVCLDGPSGVGKTSLALTFLVKEAIPYAYVQVTGKMTWLEFCRRLLTPVTNDELGMSGDLEFGLDKGLPTGKIRVSLGSKHRASDDVDYLTKLAGSWAEHDVVEAVCGKRVALIIDDAERASPELLTRLADTCKLLTTRDTDAFVKICFVGTENLFRRLLHANPSLDERLLQTTLGAFPHHLSSWHFLTIGFEGLGLRHPGTSLFPTEVEQVPSCIDAVYDAADGLPKSINALGQSIALKISGHNWVSAAEIRGAAGTMFDQNWRQYNHDFPRVLQVLDSHAICRAIVRALYDAGIARVHYASDLYLRLAEDATKEKWPISESVVREGLGHLATVDFLVLTGRSGEVVYVTHPTAAHTLGVVMRTSSYSHSLSTPLREKVAVGHSFPRQTVDGGET